MNDWYHIKAADFINFNPRESLSRNTMAKKVAMEKLQPFTRTVTDYEIASFRGGTKFRNGDTIMARITPCLENGKTAQVNFLENNEVGFGSTEFIVMRARPSVSDSDFIYYLATSPFFRKIAIQSMVGSSGRQRVQQDVLDTTELFVPPLSVQIKIGRNLRALDDKIASNSKINHHLEQMAQAIFTELCSVGKPAILSDILDVCYGKDHKRLEDGQIPCYGSGGIMRYVDKAIYTGESVLIPRKGSLNNVMYTNEAFWTVDTMFYTHMKHPNVAKLAYFTVRSLDLAGMNVGSAVPSMTTSVLNSLEIILPNDETLAKFEKIVDPMFLQIRANELESAKLANLRDTLLPRLMSGELSVSEISDAK
ncbi:MAG: restriction endonuclease subunit S [Planctomycetia bacterium]|nr:restriction endonuclease subunit S [Planctomycetia bacterium]